jgi:hypothetical protein
MDLESRISAFEQLGALFRRLEKETLPDDQVDHDAVLAFRMQMERAVEHNGWFTKENVAAAFAEWGKSLTRDNLNTWLQEYSISNPTESKVIGVVMAGNIPLVGFHDFLCVLISGHKVQVKLSSSDPYFLPLIAAYLRRKFPDLGKSIHFNEQKLENFDAVIATGSNNTARYFEHYFGSYPHIIRRNRNSVAILNGTETKEELELLGEDIFRYFGLGCRSVSKLYVPRGYDFDTLFKALYKFKDIINYKKYENNYDYNKAVYLMSLFHILENGFVMLKEDSGIASPIATVFYEYYDSWDDVVEQMQVVSDEIQCIVSKEPIDKFVNFGQSQRPKLWNYADDVDTIEFLLNI